MTRSAHAKPTLTLLVRDARGAPAYEMFLAYRATPAPPDVAEAKLADAVRAEVRPTAATVTSWALVRTGEDGFAGRLTTDDTILFAERDYDLYLLRTPDLAYAQAALNAVNGAEGAASVALAEALGDPWRASPTLEDAPLPEGESGPPGKQLVLKIPDDAQKYHPRGADRFDGWLLYQGMPHATLPTIVEHMKTLQLELGLIRYIVGRHGNPYRPEAEGVGSLVPNEGIYDVRVANAVLHFQRQVEKGIGGEKNAFKVKDVANAHRLARSADKDNVVVSSQHYLDGEGVTHVSGVQDDDARARKADGVTDRFTARALTAWIDEGLRKPGEVLVGRITNPDGARLKWVDFMRRETSESLDAWRALTVALGFECGVAFGTTFRSTVVGAGAGQSLVSNHKCGLAVDLMADGDLLYPNEAWGRVLYSQESVEKIQKRGKEQFRALWTVYAPAKLASDPRVATTEIEAALTTMSAPNRLARDVARQLLAEVQNRPADFIAAFYRDEVEPWERNSYRREGGIAKPKTTAPQWMSNPDYSRFVNLTAIAELCGLKRITSWKSRHYEEGRGGTWTVRAARVKLNTTGRLRWFAKQVGEAQRAAADVPLHIDEHSFSFDDLDLDALERWAEFVPTLFKGGNRRYYLKRDFRVSGCRVEVRFGRSRRAIAAVSAFADALESDLGSVTLDGAGVVSDNMTGAKWARWLRDRVAELGSSAPAVCTDGRGESTPIDNQHLQLRLVIAQPVSSGRTDRSGMRMQLLRLVVLRETEWIRIPKPGINAPLEWWHFERSDLEGPFGELLEDIGWTREALLGGQEVLYGRPGANYDTTTLKRRSG